MKSIKKRIISFFLATVMLFGMLPTNVLAEETPQLNAPTVRVSGTTGVPEATEDSITAMPDPDYSQMGAIMGCSTSTMVVEISETEDFAEVLETKEKLMSVVMGGNGGQIFEFTELEAGTEYYFRAKVTNVTGYQDSDYSAVVTATTDEATLQKLNAPSVRVSGIVGVREATEDSITAVPDPDYSQIGAIMGCSTSTMVVEISATEDFAEVLETKEKLMSVVMGGGDGQIFEFTELEAGTEYYFRAKVTNVTGYQDSDYSAVVTATTDEATLPKLNAPTVRVSGTTGVPEATEDSITAMPDPDYSQMGAIMGCSTSTMVVEISETKDFTEVLETKEKLMSVVMGGNGGQIFEFTGLEAGTEYYFRAKVTNVTGYQDSDYSAVAKATTVAAAPSDKTAPTISSVTVDESDTEKAVVTVTATDDVSEPSKLLYSFNDGGSWESDNTKTYTENMIIAANTIQVKDEAGNISTYNTQISIDHIGAEHSIIDVEVVENGTYSATVVVTAESEGDTLLEYSFDGGITWTNDSAKTYAENITLEKNQIQVRAGAVVVTYLQTVEISNIKEQDTTKPVISDVTVTANGTTSATVTVTASDSTDTLLWYSFDGGKTWGTDASRTFTANCTLEAGSILVKDAAGNTASYGTAVEITNIVSQESLNYGELVVKYAGQQMVTKTDETAANTYWICVPADSAGKTLDSAVLPYPGTLGLRFGGTTGYSPSKITINFTEDGITVYRQQGAQIMYIGVAAKFYFLTPDAWAAKFEDADTVAPEVYVTVTKDKSTSATVTVNAVDAANASLLYSFDGGSTWSTKNTKTYTENVEIVADQIQVRDSMQNVGKYSKSISITGLQKDETAPAIVKVEMEKVGTGSANVTVTAKDAGSDALQYSFNGGTSWQSTNVKTYKEDTTLAANSIWVKDASGNIAKYRGVIVISGLDSKAPVINDVAFKLSADFSYATVTVDAQDNVSENLLYSFDSGKTWQSGNTKHYVNNITVAKNTIQVKDEADNIAKYGTDLTITGIEKITKQISTTQYGDSAYLENITVTGLKVDGVTWYNEKFDNSDPDNIRYTEFWLNIHLDSNTLDDAAFDIAGTMISGFYGSYSVIGDKFLTNGQADITLKVTNRNNGSSVTYHIHLDTKQTAAPVIHGEQTVNVTKAWNETYEVDLSTIFSDSDNDTLTYFFMADGAEKQEINKVFSYSNSVGGSHVFKFQAYDGLKLSETYTVNLTVTDAEDTYTVSLQMPENIIPKFYITDGFDNSGVDILGKELSSTAAEAKDGAVVHTITIPENIERISFRGTDKDDVNWGGMSLKTDDVNETLAVRTVAVTVPSKLNSSYVTNGDVKFFAGYDNYFAQVGSDFTNELGVLSYRVLLLCRGFDLSAEPVGSAASIYVTSRKEITLATGDGVAEYEVPLASSNEMKITVPVDANLELGIKVRHYISYDMQESTDVIDNGDGTKTYSFSLASGTRYSYFIDMAGYAKYCSSFTMNDNYKENGITITAEQLQTTDAGYINRELDAVGNGTAEGYDEELGESGWVGIHSGKNVADVYLSINAQGFLNLSQGATYQIHHNRSWQIIENTVTKTHTAIYEPNYHYQVVDGNGNASNVVSINSDGLMTANTSGTAIVLITYDALNSPSSGGVYSAIWPENTGVFVVTVGGSGSVETGIQKDAEHDPFYYLKGQEGAKFTFTPEEGSTVTLLRSTLNGDSPMTYQGGFTSEGVTQNTDESVTVTLTAGRNIVKVEKNGAASYQVLTAKEAAYTITNTTSNDGKYHPGDTISVRFNTIYHPISKLAAIYNQSARLQYTAENGDSITSTANQYSFGANAGSQTVSFTIPADWTNDSYSLSNGTLLISGFGELPGAHRTKIDWVNGMGANGVAGSFTFELGELPEIKVAIASSDNTKPALKDGIEKLVQISTTLNKGFQLDLAEIFTDVDGDNLTYTVKINDAEAASADANYGFSPEKAGTYTLVFQANDGQANSDTYTVYLKVSSNPDTDAPEFDVENPDGYVMISFEDFGERDMTEDLVYPFALGTIIKPTKVPFKNGETVADVTLRLLEAMDIKAAYSYSDGSFYLSAIKDFTVDGVPYGKFGELDAGKDSGWMITLNNWFINQGAGAFTVEDGDIIEWQYTCALGADIGSDWSNQSAEIIGINFKENYGTLTPDFDKDEDAYIYTVSSTVDKIALEAVQENYSAKVTYKVGSKEYKPLQEISVENGTTIILESAFSPSYDALPTDTDRLTITIHVEGEEQVKPPTDEETAQLVIDLIKDLPEASKVTIADREKIKEASTAYEVLTDAQKRLVTNLAKLEAVEEAYNDLLSEAKGEVKDIYKETGDYLAGLGTPNVGSIGGEWLALGLARSGRAVPAGYYENVVNYVKENINKDNQLHRAKSTDNARVILALTACGYDPRDVEGYNLLEGLTDLDYVKKQGINGPIWALIAFDSHDYDIPSSDAADPVTRTKLIDTILAAQLADGGWALSGNAADADMTGMALQALAPYYSANSEVKDAVDKALVNLSAIQNTDGSFGSVDGKSSESCAQVIVALTALGIDPDTDTRFVKNGHSAVDAMCAFAVDGGGFKHILTGQRDGMATEQSYYALTAYMRFLNEETSLYDMSDVTLKEGTVSDTDTTNKKDQEAAEAVEDLIDVIGKVTVNSGLKIQNARTAYDKLTAAQKKLVENYAELTAAEADYDEAKAEYVEDLIDAIGTVTVNSETRIKKARNAYDKLTSAQKKLVENYEDLKDAEDDLEDAKVEYVEDLIDSIGTVTLNSKTKISRARTAYNNLSSSNKKDVSNLDVLEAAEAAYAKLQADSKTTTKTTTATKKTTSAAATKKVASQAESELTVIAEKVKGMLEALDADSLAGEIYDAILAYEDLTEDEKASIEKEFLVEDLREQLGEMNQTDTKTGISVSGCEWNIQLVVDDVMNVTQIQLMQEQLGENRMLGLWDIYLEDTLTDKKYDPEGTLLVKIPLALLGDYSAYDGLAVVHYTDDGKVEYLNCMIVGDCIAFNTVEFSNYAVVGYKGASPAADVSNGAVSNDAETADNSWLPWAIACGCGIALLVVLLLFAKKNKLQNQSAE